MAIDTFFAFSGVYASVDDALADYDAVHALHTEAGLIDAYDAAVVERNDSGKVKIVKKHETPTRVGGVLGGLFNALAAPLGALEPYGMLIVLGVFFLLPSLEAQLGVSVDLFSQVVNRPADAIIQLILRLTGLG